MQVKLRSALLGAVGVLAASRARADGDAAVAKSTEAVADDLDLRITLSSLLFRETGADAPAVVDQGAPLQNASPVRRYFGDLRGELMDGGLALDARVRQTTSLRYQSGADGGGEYELRTLRYRLGSATTSVTLGRQFIDAVGATKIDGVAATHQLTPTFAGTVFAGAFPDLGSRSLDTDYLRVKNDDGTAGSRIVPLTGGLGVAYQTPDYHGDVGVAAVYVAQAVPNATSQEASRVFTTSSGYWRPSTGVDLYHFALLDVAGASGVNLTNGSLGVDVRPVPNLQLSGSVNHVSTDLLAITARNLLADPDPSAIGIVQNNIALVHVSQDMARGAASLALARQRFELSVSGGLHYRPQVSVALADGTGAVAFPEAKSADVTLVVLDRHSIGGLRTSLAASLTFPIGSEVPNRNRGTVVRLAAGRMFAEQRGQVEVDVMGEHLKDVDTSSGACMSSLNVFACYGTSDTTAAQAGALVSWRIGREWLLIGDTHLGYQDLHSTSLSGSVVWPHVYSVTAFLRAQWRYR